MDTAFRQLQGNVRLVSAKEEAAKAHQATPWGPRRAEVTNHVINDSFKQAASDMVFLVSPRWMRRSSPVDTPS